MFTKPHKTSGSSLLRGKDAKKLRKDVAARVKGACTEDNLQLLITSKSTVKKVSFQAPSRMVVYAIEEMREPIFFDASGKGDFCISLYALWRVPELLPKIVVHAPVSEFVLRGADVMLPGVVFTSQEELDELRKGELRCVYARGNPSPFAVGELLVDLAEIERTGKKGRALRLLHYVGDELWRMGPRTVPNQGFLGNRVVPIDSTGATKEESDDEEGNGQSSEADVGVDLGDVSLEEKVSAEDTTERDDEADEGDVSKEDMDAFFVSALLQAIKSSRIREKQLPMLASTFHSSILLPSRVAGVSLQIKQSSFKKFSTFLKSMQQKELIGVSEKDGVQSITAINRRHPDVVAHEAYQTEEEAKREEEARANAAAGLPAFAPGQYAPEVEELVGLSPALKTLFENESQFIPGLSEHIKQKHWKAADVRALAAKYIDSQTLIDPRDKKIIRLNGPLTDALFGRKAPAGGYPERLTRPEVINQLVQKCQRFHRIKLYPGHEAKVHGGELRPIAIHAERSKQHANSIVTTMAYYQQFGIDGAAFAKEVQKKWGSSATTQATQEKLRGDDVKIQGQMVNELLDYLASKYHIPAKFCVVSYGKNVKAKKK